MRKTSSVIRGTSQITLAWLQAVLGDSVRSFTLDGSASTNAKIVRITADYTQGAPGPRRLLLKMCAPGNQFHPDSEVHFYARDYADVPDAPVPPCYDSAFDESDGAYHILMEDLGETHRDCWELEPTLEYGKEVAEALAVLHARWWRRAVPVPGQPEIDRYMAHIAPGLGNLLEACGPEIGAAGRETLEAVFHRHPGAMVGRTRSSLDFTLVHGDLNPGNILAPRQSKGRVYLIDRQPFRWSLTTWLGVSDLSYMMVHWWGTEHRRALEFPILRHYHQRLGALGVGNYPWEQLVSDYKLCAVQSLYVAVAWCVNKQVRDRMRWVWYPQLQKSLAAYGDLQCEGLL